MSTDFVTEPFTDFTTEENIQKMEAAITSVETSLGQEWSLIIDGKRVKSADQFFSRNPSNYEQVLGLFQKATAEMAIRALEASLKAFDSWSRTPATRRADYCFKIADIIRQKRFELSAWMVLETGKSWVEADADVAEAIDLIRFYGEEAIRYAGEQPLSRIPSEQNELRYIPLGDWLYRRDWRHIRHQLVMVATGGRIEITPALPAIRTEKVMDTVNTGSDSNLVITFKFRQSS